MAIDFHCPFDDLIQAAINVKGSDIDCVMCFQPIDEPIEEVKGFTFFPDNKHDPIVIVIRPDQNIEQCLDVMAHELAHVIEGTKHEDDHGPEFQRTYEAIYLEYMCIVVEGNQ